MVPDLLPWTYPAICSAGTLTLRRAPVSTASGEPSQWIETLLEQNVLVPCERLAVDPRARNFVLEFLCESGDTRAAYDQLREQFSSAVDFVVGRLPQNLNQTNHTLVLFARKSDTKRLSMPTLFGDGPRVCYRLVATGRRGDGMATSIQNLMSCFVAASGGIYFQRGGEENYSIQQFEAAVCRMQPSDFHTLVATFKLVPQKKRSDFQSAFLRVATHLQSKLPLEVTVKERCQLIDLTNLPAWVGTLSNLRNLGTTMGERLVRASPEKEMCQYSLRSIFTNPTLLEQYSVGLHGGQDTTGFGKTTCGLHLLSVYCKALQSTGALGPQQRFALVSNTLDSAKTVNFVEQGIVGWLIDEFDAHDTEQQQFLSPSMFKVLLTPMLMGTMRCKGSDTIAIPQGLLRIFTSNSSNPDEWTGQRFNYTAPMARKHIFFTVNDRLVSDVADADAELDDVGDEGGAEAAAAAGAMLDAAGV